MIAPDAVAAVLLAAGMSTRFGARDKLAVPLDGLPLGLHAARTLGRLPFARKIAVSRSDGLDFARYGFASVVNGDPAAGQAASIRMGLAEARSSGCRAVLIALADMPFVTSAHILALLERFDAQQPVVASTDGAKASPPVLFGASVFPLLDRLSGDTGARMLLREALLVTAPSAELRDVDTPLDLPADAGRPGD